MDFYLPTRILMGKDHISEFVHTFRGFKLAIITNKGKRRLDNPIVNEILEKFTSLGIEYVIADCAIPNPTCDCVSKAVECIKNHNCNAVIAIGGGSAIDCAKAAAFQTENPNSIWHYITHWEDCDGKALPIGVINTTAGTGSEINCCAVITNKNEKRALVSNSIFPKAVLIIPEIMCSLPIDISLDQLFDSMYHAIEGYFSIHANEFSSICSENCLRLCLKNLEPLVSNSRDVTIRRELCLGSLFSSMADMYGGCISAHSLGHAISAYHPEVSHGRSISLIAPSYYSILLNTDDPIVVAKKERVISIFDDYIPTCVENSNGNLGLILKRLMLHVGIKNLNLSDYGITTNDCVSIYRNARETVGELFENDPVKLRDDDYINVLMQSIK